MNKIFTALKPEQVRQGDVLVTPSLKTIKRSDIGELIKEGDGNRIVLAYGEVTGHAHAFYPQQDFVDAAADAGFKERAMIDLPKVKAASSVTKPAVSVQLFKLDDAKQYSGSDLPGQRLLRLESRSLLRHEEHSFISLPPGDYVVIQQHEGNEMEELRKVAD